MRVSVKMTISLSALCLLIAGLHGASQLRQEREDLREATEREIRLLGTAVQVSVQDSLRDRQVEDIQQTLDSLETIDPAVDIMIFDPGGKLRAQSKGSVVAPDVERAVTEAAASHGAALHFGAGGSDWRMVLGLPLLDAEGQLVGTLALVKPLDEMRRDLKDTRAAIVRSMILLVAAITGLQFLLGTAYVTRPLRKMAQAMKRLRSGDLTSSLASTRRDEVGMLAGEFDALVVDLRGAHERIAREVDSRMALENALLRADKLVTIGQLSAGLAHEIGSPLQIMSGRARSLLAHTPGPEEVRKNAAILAEQTDRISRIVEQLVAFSRRRAIHVAPIPLKAPVEAVMNLVEYRARLLGVEVSLRAPEQGPTIEGDVDQIQQVVLNLLKNALEATPAGGRITICLESVPEGASVGSNAARLTVEDTGRGMSADVLEKLFEPFFTTRATEGGTGLGLAVVKAIVVSHGGRIVAESSPGKGTRFTVDLPTSSRTPSASIPVDVESRA